MRVAVPQLQEIELFRDARGVPHLRGRCQHWRPQGAWQTEDQFSDGTLRLMGLLWAALEGGGPLLLEEPELSLHPRVICYLPQMLARVQRRAERQIFLSTHSSDLLRDDGIGLDEVILLQPSAEGTKLSPASAIGEIQALLDGGLPLADDMKRVEAVKSILPAGVQLAVDANCKFGRDEAIRRIVQDQVPYQPFPPALARDYDVVEIRRTWHFDSAVRLY